MAGNLVRIPNTMQLGNLTRGNAISQHQISSDFGSTDWRWPSPSQEDPPWLASRQIMAAVEVQVLSLGFPQMNFSSLMPLPIFRILIFFWCQMFSVLITYSSITFPICSYAVSKEIDWTKPTAQNEPCWLFKLGKGSKLTETWKLGQTC